MGRNPQAGKANKVINTIVEIEQEVKAEELKKPEVVKEQPIDKKNKKRFVKDNQYFGGN